MSCTIAVVLGHTVPPQTLLIKTCEEVSFPAFWRANHGVLIATVQATFFNVNAKENERKRRKEDLQLSSGIKVYTEKSLNVGFEFMLIMIALLFHAKFHQKRILLGVCCSIRRNFLVLSGFSLIESSTKPFEPSYNHPSNGLIAATSGPLVISMLTSKLTVNVNI